MKIFTQLADIEKIPNAKVALGFFDGIHLGHREVIARVVEKAKRELGTSVVFTFSNHPLSIIDNRRCPPKIISNGDKEELIAGLGVDILCNVPFTEQLLKLSADEFINLLRQKCQLTHVVVGDNYTYGYRGGGNAAVLKKAGQECGFSVEIVELVSVNVPQTQEKISVSSSMVRETIKEGKMDVAASLLGRFFSISGKVVDGDKRGRVLGYPTANISLAPELIIPADGVYAANILLGQDNYGGVVNIGINPTFFGRERRFEVHILDFSGDLYGQKLIVSFMARIRKEMAFTNLEQLKGQIANDIQEARNKLEVLRDNAGKC